MIYIPEHDSADRKARVIYEGKTSKLSETFTALDFLARLVTHIPGRGDRWSGTMASTPTNRGVCGRRKNRRSKTAIILILFK